MTEPTLPLPDALLKRGRGDFMRKLAEEVLRRLMAYDVEGQIGAGRYRDSDCSGFVALAHFAWFMRREPCGVEADRGLLVRSFGA